MIFVDTGIWYSLLVPDDADHVRVVAWFTANDQPLVTSDYVTDELLTLMRARGERVRAVTAGEELLGERLASVLKVKDPTLAAAFDVYKGFNDKSWSFTDCASYALIEEAGITVAASHDHHFRQFGIVQVVP